jgi:surface protein
MMARRHGSTLTELVVAVGIMMVLAAVSVPVFLNQRQQSWRMSVKNDVAAASVVANSFMRQGSTGTSGGVAGAAYVTPASDTDACSPSACTVTFDNTTGSTPVGRLDAQHSVTVTRGNSLRVAIADHRYTVTGSSSRIAGWSYVFDSTSGAGSWKQNNTTNFKKASSSCPVSLDGTKLIIGKDGMTCKLSTALVDSVVTGSVRDKITEVDLHGHIVIVDGFNLFSRMPSLTSMPYLPGQSVTSSVNGVSYAGMFQYDFKLTTPDSISHWDTLNVTDMSSMFYYALVFNQSVSNFNTSKVTDMSHMFGDARAFNQSVSNFDTSKATDMSYMFEEAEAFNQPVSNFDTSKVTDMSGMFGVAYAFNQSVSNFDTSKVTDMSGMLGGARAFNQSVSNFDTSKVTDMSYMFNDAYVFDQDVSNFDTSKVTDMSNMFGDAYAFNQPVSSFDTSNVTNMSGMLDGARAFNQSVSNFVTRNVTDMSYMFKNAYVFDQDVSNFDTRNVTNMSYMFKNAYAFNHSVSNFNTSSVTNMRYMFNGAYAFDQDLTGWNVDNVTSHYNFNYNSALTADHLPKFTS